MSLRQRVRFYRETHKWIQKVFIDDAFKRLPWYRTLVDIRRWPERNHPLLGEDG